MSTKNKATTLHVENVKKGLQAEINKLKNRVEKLEHRKQPTQAAGNKKGPKKARLPKLTGEDQIAHIERIRNSEKSKKEKSKEITEYVESEVAAGRAPVAPRAGGGQPHAAKPRGEGRQTRDPETLSKDVEAAMVKLELLQDEKESLDTALSEVADENIPGVVKDLMKNYEKQLDVACKWLKITTQKGLTDDATYFREWKTKILAEKNALKNRMREERDEAEGGSRADIDDRRDADRDAVRDEDNPLFGRYSQRKRVKEEDMDEYEQNLRPLVESRFRQPSFGGGLGRRGMLSRWG